MVTARQYKTKQGSCISGVLQQQNIDGITDNRLEYGQPQLNELNSHTRLSFRTSLTGGVEQ